MSLIIVKYSLVDNFRQISDSNFVQIENLREKKKNMMKIFFGVSLHWRLNTFSSCNLKIFPPTFLDVCAPVTCKPNQECKDQNGSGICQCRPGYYKSAVGNECYSKRYFAHFQTFSILCS